MNNILYSGNCIDILHTLDNNTVDLIYLDPPFFSNRKYEITNDQNKIIFDDTWSDGLDSYLDFMNEILNQSHRILKKSGLIFVHSDYHASHYLKIEMDKTFNIKNFRNEIIWKRHNSQNNTKQGAKIFGRIHDTILMYSKSNNYKWNQIYTNYSKKYVEKTYNKIDDETGELYALGDLSGPGGSSKGNPYFEFMGHRKYWRYNKEKMNKLYDDGLIIQTTPKTVPKLKRYLKNMHGVPVNDIWTDLHSEQTTNRKIVTYPTQKPMSLLDRIIRSSTNSGDVVLDPCCGSGTSLISSALNSRKWVGIDNNSNAIKTILKRFEQNNIKDYKLCIPPIKNSHH